jgi:hypothetical protein
MKAGPSLHWLLSSQVIRTILLTLFCAEACLQDGYPLVEKSTLLMQIELVTQLGQAE